VFGVHNWGYFYPGLVLKFKQTALNKETINMAKFERVPDMKQAGNKATKESAADFVVKDKRSYLEEAVKEAEGEIAKKRFDALSLEQREELEEKINRERGFVVKDKRRLDSDSGESRVVDIDEHRPESPAVESTPATQPELTPEPSIEPEPEPESEPELPPAAAVESLPVTTKPSESVEPGANATSAIERWLVAIQPYEERLSELERQATGARAQDAKDPQFRKANPLGVALRKRVCPVIRSPYRSVIHKRLGSCPQLWRRWSGL